MQMLTFLGACITHVYTGSLYGVKASVNLTTNRHAILELRGIPIGGRFSVTAQLLDDTGTMTQGSVVIDDLLNASLQRLRASALREVEFRCLQGDNRAGTSLFGNQRLVLERTKR